MHRALPDTRLARWPRSLTSRRNGMSRLKSKGPSPLVRVTVPDVSLEMWRRSLASIGIRPADNPAGADNITITHNKNTKLDQNLHPTPHARLPNVAALPRIRRAEPSPRQSAA